MSSAIYLLIGLVTGGVVCFVIGWLVGRSQAAAPDNRLEAELRQQLAQRDTDLASARTQLIEVGNSAATALAAKTAAENSLTEHRQARDNLQIEVSTKRDSLARIGFELATARAQLAAERTALSQLVEKHQKAGETIMQLQEQLQATRQANGSMEAQLNALQEKVGTERQQAENSLTELRLTREHLQAEVSTLRDSQAQIGAELATAHAQLKAERTTLAQLIDKHQKAEEMVIRLQEQLLETRQANGSMQAQLSSVEEKLRTERQQVELIQQKFQTEFEAVSNKLLVENSARFNQQSGENLEKLLSPLKENLNEFKTKLETAHRDASTNSALLKDQIGRIGTEAANLSKALKGDVKVLGNWGENMLDQILEKSGLQNGVHYRRQEGAKGSGGEQRFLDVIIELPDKKNLIIDSKVSLKNYEQYVNAPDETTRSMHLESHVESIQNHFRALGAKRYQDIHEINAPDFVLMYVPIEAAFFVALAHEPGLFAEALDKNVVLITNSTLLATLRTVASVWRLADQQKNALEIADRGGKLYDKFVGFINDLQDIGTTLAASRQAWEAASNKLHTGSGNLISQVEKLKTLGAKAAKTIPSELPPPSS